jgi:hypothetical protein
MRAIIEQLDRLDETLELQDDDLSQLEDMKMPELIDPNCDPNCD